MSVAIAIPIRVRRTRRNARRDTEPRGTTLIRRARPDTETAAEATLNDEPVRAANLGSTHRTDRTARVSLPEALLGFHSMKELPMPMGPSRYRDELPSLAFLRASLRTRSRLSP